MQTVAFYSVYDQSEKHPQYFEKSLCRLLEKIHNQDLNIHVYHADSAFVDLLNNTLWTFSTGAFIPHGTDHFLAHYQKRHPVYLRSSQTTVNNPDVFVSLVPEPILFDKKLIYFYKSEQAEAFEKIRISSSNSVLWTQDRSGQWIKQSMP